MAVLYEAEDCLGVARSWRLSKSSGSELYVVIGAWPLSR